MQEEFRTMMKAIVQKIPQPPFPKGDGCYCNPPWFFSKGGDGNEIPGTHELGELVNEI